MYTHLDQKLIVPIYRYQPFKETWLQVLLVLYTLTDLLTFLHVHMCIMEMWNIVACYDFLF